jgi:hypothetical protein
MQRGTPFGYNSNGIAAGMSVDALKDGFHTFGKFEFKAIT